MGIKIDLQVDDAPVRSALHSLHAALHDIEPALKQIGDVLLDSTKQRFKTSTAPDGSFWEANSVVTELLYLNRFKGSFKKSGQVSAKGAKRLGNKRPLIGETKALSGTISYRTDTTSLEIGSPQIYAATQQFGARQGQYGSNRAGRPIPWGDIPARPFLGLSDADRESVLQIVYAHLSQSVRG